MSGLFGGGSAQVPAIPAPTPPVQPDAAAVVAAQQATTRQQLNRRSISSTIYAGATGGWRPTPAAGQAAAPSVSTGATKTG